MHIVRKSQVNKVKASPTTTIFEYLMEEQGIKGKILTPPGQKEFSAGDVIFIDKQERFAWQGNFTIKYLLLDKTYEKAYDYYRYENNPFHTHRK